MVGKLRKLRRQIERDPCAWIDQSEWERRWYPNRAYRCRYALEGKRGNFRPGLYAYRNDNGPYQQFVRRVLLDLGYNVR